MIALCVAGIEKVIVFSSMRFDYHGGRMTESCWREELA